MKKIWKYFFFIISLSLAEGWDEASAQNLVPNPSFESYDTCVSSTNQVQYATGWNSFGSTPDYFNSCNTNVASVPINNLGHQV